MITFSVCMVFFLISFSSNLWCLLYNFSGAYIRISKGVNQPIQQSHLTYKLEYILFHLFNTLEWSIQLLKFKRRYSSTIELKCWYSNKKLLWCKVYWIHKNFVSYAKFGCTFAYGNRWGSWVLLSDKINHFHVIFCISQLINLTV